MSVGRSVCRSVGRYMKTFFEHCLFVLYTVLILGVIGEKSYCNEIFCMSKHKTYEEKIDFRLMLEEQEIHFLPGKFDKVVPF